MSNNTRSRTVYTVAVAGTEVATRTEKAAAVKLAEQSVTAEGDKLVTVTTGAGTEVFRHEPVAEAGAPVETVRGHFKPWTRVDDASFVEALDVPADYVVAYTRNRIQAAAARHAGRKGWVILQLQADGSTLRQDAVNTKEGQEIFNALRQAQLAARAVEAPAAEEVTASE